MVAADLEDLEIQLTLVARRSMALQLAMSKRQAEMAAMETSPRITPVVAEEVLDRLQMEVLQPA